MIPARETHGPLDSRPIEPGDIGEARARLGALLRGVRETDGHRAAVTTALAAVMAAVDGLVALGCEGATRDTLRMALSDLDQREACRSAGAQGGRLH